MKLRRFIPLVVGILALALALAAPAFAQNPSQSAYSGVGADQLSQANEPSDQVTATSTSSLPFTGLDIGAVVLAGAVLGGTGLVLRRWTRSSTN